MDVECALSTVKGSDFQARRMIAFGKQKSLQCRYRAKPVEKIGISVNVSSLLQIDLDCNPDEVGVIFSAELGLQHGGRVGNGFIGYSELGRDF